MWSSQRAGTARDWQHRWTGTVLHYLYCRDMSEIANRTLDLLSLLQAQKEWSGRDLAVRLNVDVRTVRRDIKRLRELGYPVDAGMGRNGHYRLAPGSQLPPLIFDDDQAIAIALALQTAPRSVQDMGDSATRALSTIRDLLPPHLARRLETFSVEQMDNAWDLAPPTVSSVVLARLSQAAQEREVVKFEYEYECGLAPTTEELNVVAEPHKLVVWSGRWYLIAFSQRQKSWHAFRLDRMQRLRSPGWRFTPREFPADDVSRFIQLQPGRGDNADAWPCRGTVVMDCPVELVARWAPGGANVESVDERLTRITMGAWSWAGILGLLATFGADFAVENPPELARAAHKMANRLDKAAHPLLDADAGVPS